MGALTSHEIARSNWTFFFNGFSRLHGGWRVTIEEVSDGPGARTVASDMAFEGIADLGSTITIMVAESPARHLAHTVHAPEQVLLDQSPVSMGFGEVLEIVGAGGTRTLLRFHAPSLPEPPDGVG
jgi:hypothetical protein